MLISFIGWLIFVDILGRSGPRRIRLLGRWGWKWRRLCPSWRSWLKRWGRWRLTWLWKCWKRHLMRGHRWAKQLSIRSFHDLGLTKCRCSILMMGKWRIVQQEEYDNKVSGMQHIKETIGRYRPSNNIIKWRIHWHQNSIPTERRLHKTRAKCYWALPNLVSYWKSAHRDLTVP